MAPLAPRRLDLVSLVSLNFSRGFKDFGESQVQVFRPARLPGTSFPYFPPAGALPLPVEVKSSALSTKTQHYQC